MWPTHRLYDSPQAAPVATGDVHRAVDKDQVNLTIVRSANLPADVLVRLASSTDLRTRMGEAAYRRVAGDFAWEHIAEAMSRIYHHVTAASEPDSTHGVILTRK